MTYPKIGTPQGARNSLLETIRTAAAAYLRREGWTETDAASLAQSTVDHLIEEMIELEKSR